MNKQVSKNKIDISKKGIYLGIFWVISGIFLFVNNLVFLHPIVVFVYLFLSSAYLIFLSIKNILPKFYFVLGLVIVAVFFGYLVVIYAERRLLWPVIMGILGLGIVLYGFLFEKHSMIKYFVSGIILLLINVVLFVLVLEPGRISLYEILVKSWPAILIFFGMHQIYLRIYFKYTDDDQEDE